MSGRSGILTVGVALAVIELAAAAAKATETENLHDQ